MEVISLVQGGVNSEAGAEQVINLTEAQSSAIGNAAALTLRVKRVSKVGLPVVSIDLLEFSSDNLNWHTLLSFSAMAGGELGDTILTAGGVFASGIRHLRLRVTETLLNPGNRIDWHATLTCAPR